MNTKKIWHLMAKKCFKWNWHIFPLPKDVLILSVYEFVFYTIIFFVVVFIYGLIQTVPIKNDSIEFQNIYVGSDRGSLDYKIFIKYKKPMTFAYAHGEEEHGNCIIHVKDKKESLIIYNNDGPEDSLLTIYKSFSPDEFNDSSSIYHIKFVQHDEIIENTLRFIEYPWTKKTDGNSYGINKLHKEKEGFIQEYVGPSGGITVNDISSGPLSRPKWYSLYDISQSYFDLTLKARSVVSGRLEIDFVGATEFSRMNPIPDIITMNSIVFTDSAKIKAISYDGLKFHAKFVELENFQSSRIFVVGAIMSALFAILLTFVVIAIYKIGRKIRVKEKNNNSNDSEGNNTANDTEENNTVNDTEAGQDAPCSTAQQGALTDSGE